VEHFDGIFHGYVILLNVALSFRAHKKKKLMLWFWISLPQIPCEGTCLFWYLRIIRSTSLVTKSLVPW